MKKFLFLCSFLFLGTNNFVEAATETIKLYPVDDVTQQLYDGDNIINWDEARNYQGELVTPSVKDGSTVAVRADKHAGKYRIYRASLLFDTSKIPSNAQIKSSSMNIYRYQDYDNDPVVFTSHTRASTTNFIKSDWQIQNYGVEFARGIPLSEQYTSYIFNSAGNDYINPMGYTDIGVMISWDYDNFDKAYTMTGSAFYSSEALGTSTDPYLEITYEVPDVEEKDIYDLTHELVDTVIAYAFPRGVEQSYMANLKKIEGFLNSAKYLATENQLRAFIKKLEQDYRAGKITEDQLNDLEARANAIVAMIPSDAFGKVPLITQIVSPYPSIASTTSWASAVYAGGRASTTGDCGLTIGQCGCAISSLSMLGQYNGVQNGADGKEVNPLNLNNWLLAHDGYTASGTLLWNYALAYMGVEKDGKHLTHFSLAPSDFNVTDRDTITNFIDTKNPVLAFNKKYGHWMVLTGVTDMGYSVNDPFWYNTKTTNDVRSPADHMNGYDDTIAKANLFEYSSALKPIDKMLEATLESPAELLVTDENGKRLGYDPTTDTSFSEILGGSYDREDFIMDQESNQSPHNKKHLMLVRPEGDVFEVKVIGTGAGEYHFTTAVSDGDGGIFGNGITGFTTVGKVDDFTVVTNSNTDTLPVYLKNILARIPAAEQKKFIQAFRVVFAQTEKDHVAVTATLIENLIRYTEKQYGKTTWAGEVIVALKELL